MEMTAGDYLQELYKRRQEAFSLVTQGMTVREAATLTNLSIAQVSRIRNGVPICERRARQIESAFGMEYGSLDA